MSSNPPSLPQVSSDCSEYAGWTPLQLQVRTLIKRYRWSHLTCHLHPNQWGPHLSCPKGFTDSGWACNQFHSDKRCVGAPGKPFCLLFWKNLSILSFWLRQNLGPCPLLCYYFQRSQLMDKTDSLRDQADRQRREPRREPSVWLHHRAPESIQSRSLPSSQKLLASNFLSQ